MVANDASVRMIYLGDVPELTVTEMNRVTRSKPSHMSSALVIMAKICCRTDKKNWKVVREFPCLSVYKSNRRVDLLVYHNNNRYGFILHQTSRFDTDQPEQVNEEKKRIYDPYRILSKNILIIGLACQFGQGVTNETISTRSTLSKPSQSTLSKPSRSTIHIAKTFCHQRVGDHNSQNVSIYDPSSFEGIYCTSLFRTIPTISSFTFMCSLKSTT